MAVPNNAGIPKKYHKFHGHMVYLTPVFAIGYNSDPKKLRENFTLHKIDGLIPLLLLSNFVISKEVFKEKLSLIKSKLCFAF